MTKDQSLRLALEYVELVPDDRYNADHIDRDALITTIKTTLEAKDEPVVTKNNDGVTLHLGWDDLPVGTKLYAAPPQRTWVGLTDEDLKLLSAEWRIVYGAWMDDFAKDIEAKLKEKNS